MADRLADGGAAGGHSRPSGRRLARRFPHVATGCEARYCSVLVSIKGDTDGVLRLPKASRTSEGFSASTEYFARQSHCPVYAIPAPSKNINRATNPAETARDQFWGKNAPAVCLVIRYRTVFLPRSERMHWKALLAPGTTSISWASMGRTSTVLTAEGWRLYHDETCNQHGLESYVELLTAAQALVV